MLSRTYRITSDAKAFQPNMAGYSIFGDCLDGSDQGIRLDYYMEEERANVDGWKVQKCYILEQMPDVVAMPNIRRVMRNDGSLNYCFGDIIIHVSEILKDGKFCLQPIAGIQNTCGKWGNLPIDRLYGYCELLERHINKEGNSEG